MRGSSSFPAVTLGHIRAHGCRDLLVYCCALDCNHGAVLNADRFPDETPVRRLGRRMLCTWCGHVGADVRPDWRAHTNRARPGSAAGAPPAARTVARGGDLS